MSLFNRNDKSGDTSPQSETPQAKEWQFDVPQPHAAQAKAPAAPPAPIVPPSPPPAKAGANMASVISKALKITGELESTEDIQIDGQIDGDVRGVGVKIGQTARVKGTVYGDEVELSGAIDGRIESKKVTLAGTARMTGDVWFQDIKIESGAYISGNLKPDLGRSDAKSDAKSDGKSDTRPAAKTASPAASVSPLTTNNGAAAAQHY